MPLREVALVYGALGDRDQAFEYLDRAFEEELASLYFLEVHPMAARLRDDPRLDELFRKLGVK